MSIEKPAKFCDLSRVSSPQSNTGVPPVRDRRDACVTGTTPLTKSHSPERPTCANPRRFSLLQNDSHPVHDVLAKFMSIEKSAKFCDLSRKVSSPQSNTGVPPVRDRRDACVTGTTPLTKSHSPERPTCANPRRFSLLQNDSHPVHDVLAKFMPTEKPTKFRDLSRVSSPQSNTGVPPVRDRRDACVTGTTPLTKSHSPKRPTCTLVQLF